MLAVPTAACVPDLPPCDPSVAEAVVLLDPPTDLTGDDGVPMTLGQALAYGGCGGDVFCHAARAEGVFRAGAPRGLDFDVGVPCLGYVCAPADADLARVAHGRAALLDEGEAHYAQVTSGAMPPGAVGARLARWLGGARHLPTVAGDFASGAAVDGLDTAAGRRAFGVWLACGAPTVTRTEDTADPALVGAPCPGDVDGSCRLRLHVTPDPLPTCADGSPSFDGLYTRLFAPLCAEACHGDASPEASTPRLGDADHTYAELLRPVEPTPAVVPGDASASHLVHHLDGLFGAEVMPRGRLSGRLRPEARAAVRAWIEAGARRHCAP